MSKMSKMSMKTQLFGDSESKMSKMSMKTQLSGNLTMKCIGFSSFCLTWPSGWPRDQIAQRPPNVKNVKNVNEIKAFWRFRVKNVKNVNENTAF